MNQKGGEPPAPTPDDVVVAEMLHLTSRAGYSLADQRDLQDSISLWLPRFFRRSSLSPDAASVELVLLRLVSSYTRRLRNEVAEEIF
jgi:hypothetical protein